MTHGGTSDGVLLKICWQMKTLHERRFETPFRGPIISFGAELNCHPTARRQNPPRNLHRICVEYGERLEC